MRTKDERKRESKKKRMSGRKREKNNIIIIQVYYSTVLHIRWYCSRIVKKFINLEGRMECFFCALMIKYTNICFIQSPMGRLLRSQIYKLLKKSRFQRTKGKLFLL